MWRSTRSTWSPGTRASRQPSPKGAARSAPQTGSCAGPRRAGEGQATRPRPDPAGWAGGPAHAGRRAAEDDPAGHRGRRRQGCPRPHRRVRQLRSPTGLGWGYRHKTVCHGRGEYARDEDGDGVREGHVNAMEGTWSLLRSWLRPHRGIPQEKLPLYLGFFEFVHNARRRGRALLGTLIAALVV